VPPALIGVVFIVLPTIGLLIRAPWSGLARIYSRSDSSSQIDVGAALSLSAITSLIATAGSLVLGVPLAWVLARTRWPGLSVLRAAVTMPLILPPVVGGLALLLTLGTHGVVGQHLFGWFGWEIPFTRVAIVLAQMFVAMPFLVVTMEGAFRTGDRGLEEAAATLGASRSRTFTHVTLPLVLPSLAAGTVLCWARAFGEFGATMIFAGSVIHHTQTGSTAIWLGFQASTEDAVALSLPMMLIAVLVLALLRDRWLRPGAVS
jgi:molybdate transport system permease protein